MSDDVVAQKGPEFSDVQPTTTTTGALLAAGGGSTGTIVLSPSANTLLYGPLTPVGTIERSNTFRPGQQVIFFITIYTGAAGQAAGQQYVSRVRLKPWWLRPNREFRGAGHPTWLDVDETAFEGATQTNNLRVWLPEAGFIPITQFQTPPPPAAAARHVDYLFEQKVWAFDLPDPGDAAVQAALLPGQAAVGFSFAFLWVSHGYALALSSDTVLSGQGGSAKLSLDLNWVTGALG